MGSLRFKMIFPLLMCIFMSLSTASNLCHNENKKLYVVHTTRLQQMKNQIEARKHCKQLIKTTPFPSDDVYCNMSFGGGVCWPYSPPDTEVEINCPDYVHGFYIKGKVKRYCTANGTWKMSSTKNKISHNFSECLNHHNEEIKKVAVSDLIREHAYNIKILNEVGYGISITLLLVAVFLRMFLRKLHCQRNTVHLNLFISFILRAVISVIKDLNLLPPGSVDVENNEIHFISDGITWPCKIVFTLFHYMLTANYMWIFVEGIYLHTLIFFAMSNRKKLFKFYIIFGWLSPVPSVLAWTIVRIKHADTLCWSTDQNGYLWIIKGPIVAAIAINFILFLNIIRVLFTKLMAPQTADPRKYRKLAQSTLVLIPLFGVYYILFTAVPDCIDNYVHVVLMYVEIICSSFQGVLVSILFCFINSEVRGELMKLWSRRLLRRQSMISTRSSGASVFIREKSKLNNGKNVDITENKMTSMRPSDSAVKMKDLENNDVTLKVNGANVNVCSNDDKNDDNEDETSSML